MARSKKDNQLDLLAQAMLKGQSIAEWARQNGVEPRTCYNWTKTPEFQARLDEYRDAVVKAAILSLTSGISDAADEIKRLIKKGKSDAIRLAASRALFAETIAISNFAELKAEFNQLRGEVEGLRVNANARNHQQTKR